jgi:hypothetical protein
MNLGSGDAVEETADVQRREASIVEVVPECGYVATRSEVVEVMWRSPAAADLRIHRLPRLPAEHGGDKDLRTLLEEELVFVGPEHRAE